MQCFLISERVGLLGLEKVNPVDHSHDQRPCFVFVILKNHPELPLVRRNENIGAGRGHGCVIDQNFTTLVPPNQQQV